jgi:hypothetical protein
MRFYKVLFLVFIFPIISTQAIHELEYQLDYTVGKLQRGQMLSAEEVSALLNLVDDENASGKECGYAELKKNFKEKFPKRVADEFIIQMEEGKSSDDIRAYTLFYLISKAEDY